MSVRTKLAAFALASWPPSVPVPPWVPRSARSMSAVTPSAPATPPPPDHEMGGHG